MGVLPLGAADGGGECSIRPGLLCGCRRANILATGGSCAPEGGQGPAEEGLVINEVGVEGPSEVVTAGSWKGTGGSEVTGVSD